MAGSLSMTTGVFNPPSTDVFRTPTAASAFSTTATGPVGPPPDDDEDRWIVTAAGPTAAEPTMVRPAPPPSRRFDPTDEVVAEVGVRATPAVGQTPTPDPIALPARRRPQEAIPLPAPSKARSAPRLSVALDGSYCPLDSDVWLPTSVTDLSISGALLLSPKPLAVGDRLELRLSRGRGEAPLEVLCQVARRDDGRSMGVRFVHLSAEVTRGLAGILNGALNHADDHAHAGDVGFGGDIDDASEAERLSLIALRERSIYDVLALDPGCSDQALAEACEAFIARVERVVDQTSGVVQQRLRVLNASLQRLRPLWADPVKRVRYDFRWGYVRANERIEAANEGTGLHMHLLAGIWMSLYPERVRAASSLWRAGDAGGARAAELDPFCHRWRSTSAPSRPTLPSNPNVTSRLQLPSHFSLSRLEQGLDGLAALAAAPASNSNAWTERRGVNSRITGRDTEIVRGALADIPLDAMVQTLFRDHDDGEIVIRRDGVQVGSIGVAGGFVVVSRCGDTIGPGACAALAKTPGGRFVVQYEPPPPARQHMRLTKDDYLAAAGIGPGVAAPPSTSRGPSTSTW